MFPFMKYKVIIIEDDPMVASINKQYVQRNSQLELAGIFSNGADGLKYLQDHTADLILKIFQDQIWICICRLWMEKNF